MKTIKTIKQSLYIKHFTVNKTVAVRDSDRISIAGRVQLIKGPCSGFNDVLLMSIRDIENKNAFH